MHTKYRNYVLMHMKNVMKESEIVHRNTLKAL